ncbi:NAD(P)H-hydrate dehydratase [Vallicoccus soli]|uniref:Bifunctional NAD(P)H-hydrate repair enzyme n=1 Tax=Vallicoccus soli TaxID=2339232 RepID=A0A3A3YQH5_9ACTN|nr:NAD(P)H-hydrate dehydratase [Vallicoccus soli]RJK93483.1 NAD(P)H-hydrate dehydratase [Vallicoccus soli]
MRQAHGVGAVRAGDAAAGAGLPGDPLMLRAAHGLARTCALLLDGTYGSRVVLLVGSGGNGGDALHAGAALALRGARVDALLLTDRPHAGGLAALRAAGGRAGSDAAVLDDADLVIDGIVGIGGRGGLREDAARLVAHAEATAATLVAVDVPSGVDAGTGEVPGAAVHADVTVTFGALKPGLLVDPGAGCAGVVELVDLGPAFDAALGAPEVEALEAADVAALLPAPTAESDKYRRGVVGVAAGSDAYTGAAVLAVGGALRAGAGMVRYSGPDLPTALVRRRWPEAVVGEGRVQAHVVGPGLGTDDAGLVRLRRVLGDGLPAVVDADGLTLLAGEPPLGGPLVLTPHAGEAARLLGADRADVEARRLEHAQRAARAYDAVVLLKGSTTVVAAPDGRVRVNATGTPWLATAGSGDVLSGVVGALLGGGLDPFDAASAGAWLHGAAGRLASGDEDGTGLAGGPVVAEDLLDALPRVRRDLA